MPAGQTDANITLPTSNWSEWLVSYRTLLAALFLFAVCCTWAPSRQLAFDQSIESLYASSNPRLLDFQKSKRTFGGDEFVILAYEDRNLFTEGDRLSDASRQQIVQLAEALRQVPGVQPESVQHLADSLKYPYGRHRIRKLMEGLMVGTDGITNAVICRLIPQESSTAPRDQTFRQIKSLAANNTPPAVVVGEPIQVQEMFRYVEEDGRTLGYASTALQMAIVFFFFRNPRWMLLPFIVIQGSLVLTRGLLAISGFELSMVSSMLNSLVTIIGIATLMHVTVRFREYRVANNREPALRLVMRDLLVPIFWTCATTAAGFASVLVSEIAPAQDFGLMMALATGLIFVATVAVVPIGVLAGPEGRAVSSAPGESWVVARLGNVTRLVSRFPGLVAAIMLGFASFGVAGLWFLKVETDFSKNFRASSPLVTSLDFFETRLGGAGNWEVNFAAPDVLTDEYLEQVRNLAAKLREIRPSAQSTNGQAGTLTKVLVPERLVFTRLSLETRLGLLNAFQSTFLPSLYNPTASRMRILLRSLERQSAEEKINLITEVERISRDTFPDARATGLFVLLAYLIESLMSDQLLSFSISASMLVLLMSIAQRSIVLGLVLLIPNLFPIAMVIGAMGWMGLPINIATAMIASVSLGLTVDSSIHYLAGYRRFLASGKSVPDALRLTNENVGWPLLIANFALATGFLVLCLSHFIPLVYFGLLVALAMLGGLLGNLILLPLLLTLLEARKPSETAAQPADV
jgi:uncharacterized protein